MKQFRPAGQYLLQHCSSKVFYFCKRAPGRPTLRVSLKTTSKEEARLLRAQKLKELALQQEQSPHDILPLNTTFAALAQTYLDKLKESTQVKESSRYYYQECVKVIERTFKAWAKPVAKITAL